MHLLSKYIEAAFSKHFVKRDVWSTNSCLNDDNHILAHPGDILKHYGIMLLFAYHAKPGRDNKYQSGWFQLEVTGTCQK